MYGRSHRSDIMLALFALCDMKSGVNTGNIQAQMNLGILDWGIAAWNYFQQSLLVLKKVDPPWVK